MSTDESAALGQLRDTIKWLIGGVAGLLLGAMTVGAWVATQESRITSLQEADRTSLAERGELRGRMQLQSDTLNSLRQDAALQNRDLQYIRESVTKIEQVLIK